MFKNYNRRQVLKGGLKSAGGVSVAGALSLSPLSLAKQNELADELEEKIKTDPWLTLNATLNHLLPASKTGPSAKEIKALNYLYQIMTVQPTPLDEKEFIYKGVGWLNSYAKSEKSSTFVNLNNEEKEQLLRGISGSTAGRNWINTLLNYILEAMLSPSSYGGNPQGIGWQWLEHQGGFPLPKKGQRYFEIPVRSVVLSDSNKNSNNQSAKVNHGFTRQNKQGLIKS